MVRYILRLILIQRQTSLPPSPTQWFVLLLLGEEESSLSDSYMSQGWFVETRGITTSFLLTEAGSIDDGSRGTMEKEKNQIQDPVKLQID